VKRVIYTSNALAVYWQMKNSIIIDLA